MENRSSGKQFVSSWIETNEEAFFGHSRSIWEFAELGCLESRSSALLAGILRENGFEVQEGVAGMPTAFIATWGAGRPVIAFGCEYDALPGLATRPADEGAQPEEHPAEGAAPGHGCGHSLLGVGGVMAALSAKEWLVRSGSPGRIVVLGSPAEELCIGKPFMAREGCFEGLDAVLDWHPWWRNSTNCDTCNAYFNIKYHFKGINSHGNAPWMGRSALDGAILMGHAIEMLREHIPPGNPDAANTINYTFSDVGPSYPSVVPDRSTLWSVGRITDSETMAGVMERIHKCAEGAALATGTTWSMEFRTASHEKIPNKVLSSVLDANFREMGAPRFSPAEQAVAREMQRRAGAVETGLEENIPPFREGASIVTDNSEYSWFAPFAMIWVAMAPGGIGWHNRSIAACAGSSMGRKAMTAAAKALAACAVDLIERPEILVEAKKELAERLAGRVYKPLIPEGVNPPV